MKHVAYNLDTGEVITTPRSNRLKFVVKRINNWNRRHNLPVGRWLFAHNKQGIDRIRRQIDACTTR